MGDRNPGVYNNPKRKPRRRELRRTGTPAEAILWKSLQRRQLLGQKFRRQYSLGPYIADFLCPACRLVVELDGAPHFAPLAAEYDAERTKYLEGLGLRVIRFENHAVYTNLEFVLDAIREAILTTPSAPG